MRQIKKPPGGSLPKHEFCAWEHKDTSFRIPRKSITDLLRRLQVPLSLTGSVDAGRLRAAVADEALSRLQ